MEIVLIIGEKITGVTGKTNLGQDPVITSNFPIYDDDLNRSIIHNK